MSIDIEDKLSHLSELLGELLLRTSDTFGEHAANVAVGLVVQAPAVLFFEGKPATAIFGAEPYPIDDIREALAPCTQGDPDQAETVAKTFGEAKLRLVEDFEASLGSINTTIEDWTGDAAENFKQYISNVSDAVTLQTYALEDAEVLTDALRQVIQSAQDGVHTLLDDSITKVTDAIETKRIESINTTIDGVAAGVSAAVGGNPSGFVSWVATTLTKKVVKIAVGSDAEVPQSILTAAIELASDVGDRASALKEKLGEVATAIGAGSDASNLPQVKPEKPLILDPVNFDPESFGLSDDVVNEGVEDSVSTDSLDAAEEAKERDEAKDEPPIQY